MQRIAHLSSVAEEWQGKGCRRGTNKFHNRRSEGNGIQEDSIVGQGCSPIIIRPLGIMKTRSLRLGQFEYFGMNDDMCLYVS